MKVIYRFWFNLLFSLATLTVTAQAPNLLMSYQKSDSLFVCGVDTFTLTIQNSGGNLMPNAVLSVQLPAGLEFTGAVTGATPLNINNLQEPTFTLPGIIANTAIQVQLLLRANCAAADVLDAGALFLANFTVTAPDATASVTTSSIPVETGLLLIENVDTVYLEGEKGDTLYREICLKNTRLGKIGNIYLEDIHPPGYTVQVQGAATQQQTAGYFSASFGQSLFLNTGNGDGWLDINESVCFTEQIIITDCGSPEQLVPSLLRVGWGCGTTCRYDSVLAYILIQPSTKIPVLKVKPLWAPPLESCAETGSTMGVKIVNTGKAAATNASFTFQVPFESDKIGIAINSVRLLYSNGTTQVLPLNLFFPSLLPSCNTSAYSRVTTTLPFLAPNDSVQMLFDVLHCVEDCKQNLGRINVEFFYQKPCPEGGFVSDTTYITSDTAFILRSNLGLVLGSCMETGNIYPFYFKTISRRLLLDEGFLNIELNLPHGISFVDSCGAVLGNESPVNIQQAPGTSGNTLVRLTYDLPLENDTVNMNFCLRYDCDSNLMCVDLPTQEEEFDVFLNADCAACFSPMSVRTFWTATPSAPVNCSVGKCETVLLGLNNCYNTDPGGGGPVDTTEFAPVLPVGFRWKMDVYRTNYGYKDQNDDRIADDGSLASPADIRLDRYLPGDTSRVFYCAVIDSGSTSILQRRIWHEMVLSDVPGPDGNSTIHLPTASATFTNSENLRFIRDSMRIVYATGEVIALSINDLKSKTDKNVVIAFSVNSFPSAADDLVLSQRHLFEVDFEQLFLDGILPKAELSTGDSIFFFTDFKFDMNYDYTFPGFSEPVLVGFRTAVAHSGGKFAWNFHPFKRMQYSGYVPYSGEHQFTIKPCDNSVEAKPHQFGVRIARQNLFPFEIRPVAFLESYRLTVPEDLEIASAQLKYLKLQDSVQLLANVPLPYVLSPAPSPILEIDHTQVFASLIDEGFYMETNVVFKPNCLFTIPKSSIAQSIVSSYVPIGGDLLKYYLSQSPPIGYFSSSPTLNFITTDSIVTANSRDFEVNFRIKNELVTPVINAWVTVQSPSGLASDFELTRQPQNTPILPVNGIFNLSIINGFGQPAFKLSGQNLACGQDSLLIIYGWDCGQVTSLAGASCFRDSFWVLLQQEKPELELNVLTEPEVLLLCDTSEYFEFEIFNAKKGFVYTPFATVKLPDGLQLAGGTTQLFYPPVGNWVNIADPEQLPGNLYRWDVAASQPAIALSGLPGITLAPQNTLHIRFKTLALCGFIANTQNIYGTYGQDACLLPTNILNKPGERLSIEGLTPTYGVTISMMPVNTQPLVCGGEQEYAVQITLLGTPTAGDSAVVILPQGVQYLEGTYLPGLNAPNDPPTTTAAGFRLALPVLVGGGTVQFRFKVQFGSGSGCIDQLISVQTRVRTEAFCQTLGAPCAVYVSTGDFNLPIQIDHPALQIGGVTWQENNDSSTVSIQVNNIGNNPAASILAQVWFDTDGSNSLTAADSLLGSLPYDQVLAGGQSFWLQETIVSHPALRCGLMVVLPAAENCLCADVVLPVLNHTVNQTPVVVCDSLPFALGVDSVGGFQYQWLNSTGIGCATCATTVVQPVGMSQTYTLTESNNGCVIEHHFFVTFGATATLTVSNNSICAGESITLVATPADAQFLWSGPGVQTQGANVQTLQPDSTATYTVTITLSNGCTASALATALVFQPDTVQLPLITACEGSNITVFDATVLAANGVYSKLLTTMQGCDSLLLQPVSVLPKIITNAAVTFCEGDTVFLFGNIPVSTSIEVCRDTISTNGCDSTHCIMATAVPLPVLQVLDTIFATLGDTITLQGPPGFVQYLWTPAPVPPCNNCSSIDVIPDTTGYLQYGLEVKDGQNCGAETLYRVVVFPPCDAYKVLIPNAFTPNGDGANDQFRPITTEGGEVIGKLTIYNRWGQKLFESRNNVFWDGTIDGQAATSDVYVYLIEVQCGELIAPRVGEVTLIR